MRKTREPVARNRAPILEALRARLPSSGRMLELASGSGEHARFFAENLPGWEITPSDRDPDELASAAAWREGGPANLLAPVRLDVLEGGWPAGPFDAVLAINLVHIAPPEVVPALMAGAAAALRPGGLLVTYGPYRVDGAHTAPSNEAFEAWLEGRDPRYGVRDVGWMAEEAARAGLTLVERVPMPANNFTLVFAA